MTWLSDLCHMLYLSASKFLLGAWTVPSVLVIYHPVLLVEVGGLRSPLGFSASIAATSGFSADGALGMEIAPSIPPRDEPF